MNTLSATAPAPIRAVPAPSAVRFAAYGALGLPLSFAALPLYVHVPHFYVEHVGLSLAAVGLVLLLARLGDALIDPWLGIWSDWQAWCYGGDRRRLLAQALLPFAAGLVMLFIPVPDARLPWVVSALLLTYLGYSLVSINYHAWGAEIGVDAHQRTLVTAWREGLALVGVIIAAGLPSLPMLVAAGPAAGMQALAACFLVLLALASWITLRHAPLPPTHRRDEFSILDRPSLGQRTHRALDKVRAVLRDDPAFAHLLLILALSGFAAAVPATLVLFFISDVLHQPALQGVFLVVYFVAAALGLPGWVALSRRIGKLSAWASAMALAIVSFVWAYMLGPGDVAGFLAICVLTGIALGAELALPPALLAELMARRGGPGEQGTKGTQGGLYFGLWNFVTKLNLALAAGIALPLLAWLGYDTQASDAATRAANTHHLALVYAIVPALIKCLALGLLVRWRRHLPDRS